jgi:hypothetical protein
MIHPFRAYGIPPGGYPPDYQGDERRNFMKIAIIAAIVAIAILLQPNRLICVSNTSRKNGRAAYANLTSEDGRNDGRRGI